MLPPRSAAVCLLSILLLSCSAIPLKRLEPLSPTVHPCTYEAMAPHYAQDDTPQPIYSLAPAASHDPQSFEVPFGRLPQAPPVSSFAAFVKGSEDAKLWLPKPIQNLAATNALLGAVQKASGQAMLNAAIAQGRIGTIQAKENQREIDSFHVPNKLTHWQLMEFADKFFDAGLRHDVSEAHSGSPALKRFMTYLTAYYTDKFIDRFGQSVAKPNWQSWLSGNSATTPYFASIPDADISNAEIVLLEFLIDTIDPTPVLGDKENLGDATKFFPGSSSPPPTAATTCPVLVNYKQISTGCGATQSGVSLATTLAGAASDRAAAVGGLIANTPGGIVLLGKISIGDNQTLSGLVKTAASRIAMRLTYAAAYWSLEHPQTFQKQQCLPAPSPQT